MSKPMNMAQIEEQTRRAFAQDGLLFIFLGALLLLVGGSVGDTKMSWLLGLLPFLFFGIEAVRRRITYPRIGYAKLIVPQGTTKGILGFALVAVVGLSLLAFWQDRQWQQFLPVAIGWVFALSMVFGLSSIGKLRWREWLMVGVTAVSGLITYALFTDWHQAVGWQLGLLALFFIGIGVIDLLRFLKQHPAVPEEAWRDQS